MALQPGPAIPGNPISFGQIRAEFGITPNDGETAGGLGGYRVSDTIGSLSNLPLDTGVPQSGQIAFSDFYSKQLNIVVKCTGGNLAKANYGDGVVVGTKQGKIDKSRPSRNSSGWQGGKKIFINITGTYSSNGASESDWAFKTRSTGYWPSGTDMIIDVSSNGKVVGRGGNGGSQSGKNGKNGSNGLRYMSGATLNNGGYISAGGGGGGGGSKAEQNDWGDRNDAEGGGGGGGNGLPGGSGGSGNGGGGAGNMTTGGFGRSGEDDAEAEGGSGGAGGSNGANGQDAFGGKNKKENNGKGGKGGKATETY
tara:strand:- start:1334 stop:2260 length:927 start_codon:yes stop_codon:yes gene_type:complete